MVPQTSAVPPTRPSGAADVILDSGHAASSARRLAILGQTGWGGMERAAARRECTWGPSPALLSPPSRVKSSRGGCRGHLAPANGRRRPPAGPARPSAPPRCAERAAAAGAHIGWTAARRGHKRPPRSAQPPWMPPSPDGWALPGGRAPATRRVRAPAPHVPAR